MSTLKPLSRPAGLCMLLLALFSLAGQAEEVRKQAEPTRRELWVPSEHLDKVLKEHPNAVLLSPEQYEALIRDAGKVKPTMDPKDKPPVDLCVESLVLKGTVQPKAGTVRLSGTLTLFSTSEEWTGIDHLWYHPLVSARAEGTLLASLSQPIDGTRMGYVLPQRTLSLHVKGVGRHRLHIEMEVAVGHVPLVARSFMTLQSVGMPGYVDLTFPPDMEVRGGTSCRRLDEQTLRYAWGGAANQPVKIGEPFKGEPGTATSRGLYGFTACVVRWGPKGGPATIIDDMAPASQVSLDVRIDESAVEVVSSFLFTLLPWKKTVPLELTPGAEVISVQRRDLSGSQVPCTWKQTGTRLEIEPAEGYMLVVTVRQSRDPAQSEVTLPRVVMASYTVAEVKLASSEGVEILTPASPFTEMLDALPKITVRPAKPRLEVDADLVAKLEKDSVSLTRTLKLRTDRPVHELRMTLPEGEEFIRIECPMKDFEWKRVTRHLELRFPAGVTAAAPQQVTLITRQKLLKAWSGPRQPELVKIVPLAIPEAVNVSGYNALAFDDAWRVALKSTTGLEDRDVQLSPVSGRMAWFSLRDWELSFEVERAEPVFSAEITAYALPRARTVEIEGQVRLDISAAPLRSFQLRLPAASAKLLRMTSPLIGEQTLDDATGIWTYTLRQESTGTLGLRFRLSLPAEVSSSAEQTMKAKLPVLELPAARRFAGTWVIEANTDTQVSFEAQSLQPLDVLRAPAIGGYQPRHRLIAAYTYGVGAHTLALTAKRHAHSELAAMIVTRLRMNTVVGEDGTALHEANLLVQHSREQLVALVLPQGAQLLAVAADGVPVKPVQSAEGSLAVPLPPGSGERSGTRVRVQYRLIGAGWASRGSVQLEPVGLTGSVPVLDTGWQVLVPPGYTYSKVDTLLMQQHHEVPSFIPQIFATAGQFLGGRGASNAAVRGNVSFLPGGPAAGAPITEADRQTALQLQLYDSTDELKFKMSENKGVMKTAGRNDAYVDLNEPKIVASKSSLISLDLDLPLAGQLLKFSGHQAPEVLTLHYVSWERQLGFAMLAVLAGMGAFARWARRRPWRTSLLVVALLALGAPLWLSGPALALANAFLFGWLLALALWCLWRLAEKLSSFGADVNGKEAVV